LFLKLEKRLTCMFRDPGAIEHNLLVTRPLSKRSGF
jgi:hypothetical protein